MSIQESRRKIPNFIKDNFFIYKFFKPNIMKKEFYILVILTFVFFSANAQDTIQKTKQIGFNFTGSQFGVRYKTGKGLTSLRMTLLSLSSGSDWGKSNLTQSTHNNLGFGFNIGFEKKHPITEKINYYLGSDLLTSYYFSNDHYEYDSTGGNPGGKSKSSSTQLSAGIGFVIGLNFVVTERLSISTEIVPAVYYSHSVSNYGTEGELKSTSDAINYGLSTRGINVTLYFDLNKKK